MDDKVLCSEGGSGFCTTSGALERGPARDGVPCYKVHEMNDKRYVRVPRQLKQHETASMAKRDPHNKTKMVIIGGSSAGASAAETLRQSHFTGEITVISKDSLLPCDTALLPELLSNSEKQVKLLRD